MIQAGRGRFAALCEAWHGLPPLPEAAREVLSVGRTAGRYSSREKGKGRRRTCRPPQGSLRCTSEDEKPSPL